MGLRCRPGLDEGGFCDGHGGIFYFGLRDSFLLGLGSLIFLRFVTTRIYWQVT